MEKCKVLISAYCQYDKADGVDGESEKWSDGNQVVVIDSHIILVRL
jgi:hypothetical protein